MARRGREISVTKEAKTHLVEVFTLPASVYSGVSETDVIIYSLAIKKGFLQFNLHSDYGFSFMISCKSSEEKDTLHHVNVDASELV